DRFRLHRARGDAVRGRHLAGCGTRADSRHRSLHVRGALADQCDRQWGRYPGGCQMDRRVGPGQAGPRAGGNRLRNRTAARGFALMDIKDGFTDAVGNPPLILLRRLGDETGCEILGKAEFMNPGGSVKDRAAKWIVLDAERRGVLRSGGTGVEGTAGNTGIGLAHVCNARGYRCVIVMPDNQAPEKYQIIESLGAELRKVPAVPYSDPNQYQKVAGRLAGELPNAIWANQFDNVANRAAHFESTGPEIWRDTQGKLDVFCAATGTGGTLAGVAAYLKSQSPGVR